ncbi:MAG: DsbA family protein [Nitrosotalea sp.]
MILAVEMRKLIFALLFLSAFVIVGTSYVYADTMQDNSMHNNMSTNGNMSGWGNMSSMNNEKPVMVSGGSIDLSTASPVLGSPSSPVTIIEFGDYQCPNCDSWFKHEESTVKTNYIDTNKAKLYFVDFPYLGPDSAIAAQATYCAEDQGKYWQFHDYLYTNQGGIQTGWASTSNLKSYAASLGLDTTQFNSCLDSGKYADRVSHNRDIGSSENIQGTPTFFIISASGSMQEIIGAQPASAFSTVIDQISTQPVPEFGSIAALILVISIVSIIAVSAKTRLRFIAKV